ncbi:flagellar biosynthetic protein FliP [Litoreibacter halocynthiae]|uniref:Flagellar biosynthetic protein FliP n=2 Tax=Litoreibacter halocynthiae TaxID=1242689 RepID=A0A4R7LGV4_9RHOB|nr:flagellar biosynthetic protein FliP [Litoreibacter halocynthiae]
MTSLQTTGRMVVLVLTAVIFLALPAHAQDLSISLGDDASLSARAMQLIALMTVLSLAPGIAIMITCFPFVVTVLSILRQAIGLQSAPPNMLIVSLALFLTYFVMDPVFMASWENGLKPLNEGALSIEEAIPKALEPFRGFMSARLDMDTFLTLADLRPEQAGGGAPSEASFSILIPSFMLSEIERAFQIGFLVFLPFLIIDLVVSAVLMSMGMMMVPPAIVSLPFKLAFFVVADGWSLISSALVRSYI